MPGTVCSVALCRSNSNISKKKGETISFFSFPKDNNLRRKWVKKCYRQDKFNPKYKRICSKHFKIDDFEDVVAAKLKNTIPRKLKCDAIPSLYLLPKHYEHHNEDEKTASDEEKEVKARKELVEQLLAAAEEEERLRNAPTDEAVQTDREGEYGMLQNKCDKLVKENKCLKDKLEKYEQNFSKLTLQKTDLQTKVNNFDKTFKNRIRDAFSKVFTANQLNIILRNQSQARWTDDEMKKAFVLKSISKRAYFYMHHQLNYPFPSYSSIRRWEAMNVYHRGASVVAIGEESSEETISGM